MTAVRSFRGLGCPQQAFGIFVRCAAQNTMLVIFVALWRIFFAWAFLSAQAFDAPSANLELCDLISPPHRRRSFSLTLLRDALNHHRCQYSKLVRRSYRAGSAAVWWKSLSIVITIIITTSLSIACGKTHWILDSLFVHNGEYLGGT